MIGWATNRASCGTRTSLRNRRPPQVAAITLTSEILVERYGKCLPKVTAMSQRLVIMTNTHMIRLAQYSTVSWRLVLAGLLRKGLPIVAARIPSELLNEPTIAFMLPVAFCSDIPWFSRTPLICRGSINWVRMAIRSTPHTIGRIAPSIVGGTRKIMPAAG